MKAVMGFLKHPKGLLMQKQLLACGREWRTSYGKRKIRVIINCGGEEIMGKAGDLSGKGRKIQDRAEERS